MIEFIHIPKNCGTSIKRLVANNKISGFNVYDHAYDPSLLDPEKSMFILRDPIDRFLSAFYYSELYPNCPLMKNRNKIKTPSDLVDALIDSPENEFLISSKHHTIGTKKIGISWVWTPQYYWDNGAKFVLFHDNIENDFRDFLKVIDHPPVDLPFLNRSKREEFKFREYQIEYLKNRYSEDYRIINKYKEYKWKL